MGASVVGGCPGPDPDPTATWRRRLEVAAEHGGCPADLHTDGADPARSDGSRQAAGGARSGVTVGPLGGLARLPAEAARRAADGLAAPGAVACLPQAAARAWTGGVAPVRLLRAAGVRVAAGSGRCGTSRIRWAGAIRWRPATCWPRGRDAGRDAYDAVSSAARAALGLPEVRVEAGFPAELLAVRGDLAGGGAVARVLAGSSCTGAVVARTSAVREYSRLGRRVALDLPRQGRAAKHGAAVPRSAPPPRAWSPVSEHARVRADV